MHCFIVSERPVLKYMALPSEYTISSVAATSLGPLWILEITGHCALQLLSVERRPINLWGHGSIWIFSEIYIIYWSYYCHWLIFSKLAKQLECTVSSYFQNSKRVQAGCSNTNHQCIWCMWNGTIVIAKVRLPVKSDEARIKTITTEHFDI